MICDVKSMIYSLFSMMKGSLLQALSSRSPGRVVTLKGTGSHEAGIPHNISHHGMINSLFNFNSSIEGQSSVNIPECVYQQLSNLFRMKRTDSLASRWTLTEAGYRACNVL